VSADNVPEAGRTEGHRIFLSYRRSDAAAYAGRLYDYLVERFGQDGVFIDIESIEPGVEFAEAVEKTLRKCNTILVVIGRSWVTSADRDGKLRLDNPNDFVRFEIEHALASRTLRVIPVLVGGAQIPEATELPESLRGLTRRQAFDLSDQRWSTDVRVLSDKIESPTFNQSSEPEAPVEQGQSVDLKLQSQLVDPKLPSGTVTFLFGDVEGSTRLWERNPDGMAKALKRHDQLARSVIEASGGYVFKMVGDAFCAAFATAKQAVESAASLQRALNLEPWPTDAHLRVRMALHSGESEERDGDYFGPAVNRVARLVAVAHAGQIIVSRATADLMRDQLPAGTSLRDLGTHRLKDLGRPEEVFQLLADGLDADFPALRSLDNPDLLNNLPQLLSSFVGRELETAEVKKLASDNRLVTLIGTGGAGKTRLALQVGAELVDGTGDGVWLVELAAVTEPGDVAHTVAATLRIKEQADSTPLDTLVQVLHGQNRLLILDNCEHLLEACATLAETLVQRCPRLHVIATSREPLRIDGEVVFQVPPLSLPPAYAVEAADLADSGAVALFTERARARVPGFVVEDEDVAVVASICRLLDGMPLALELATARLRSMTLVELHDRLKHRFDLLTKGSRTAMPRHQTLRALVDWSYDLLTERERILLRRLSVFLGGFKLEAVEAVCNLGDLADGEIADVLGSLVDKSLVVAEAKGPTSRFGMLETLRQYGAERLNEEGPSESERLRSAHASYYVAFAEDSAPNLTGRTQDLWLAQFDDAYLNLRAAAEHLLANEEGAQLVLRLFGFPRRYWYLGSHDIEAIGLLERALDLTPTDAPSLPRAAALVCKAHLTLGVDFEAQAACALEAVEAARELGDEALEAAALFLVCRGAYYRGVAVEGLGPGAEAVSIARRLGDPVLLGESLLYYAAAVSVDDPTGSVGVYKEVIALSQQSGDLYVATSAYNDYGCLLLHMGNVAEARKQLEKALAGAQTSFPWRTATVLGNLGFVLLAEDDSAGVASMFSDCLRATYRTGDVWSQPYSMLGIACCATRLGDFDRATILHGGATALLDSCGGVWENPEKGYRDRDIAILRDRLGVDFERLYEVGRAMNLDDIVDLGLGRQAKSA
jgi:predicted ATPase/class 3 adenylate cyclase